jgi:UDP-N-acetylglucosamine transferase subunit ALG13
VSAKIDITILVAPLDWGLGHATRSIPIITYLLQSGCKVIIAAEGAQEILLKTEFPDLTFVHLQGYRIKYASDKRFFSLKIISQLPKIARAIKNENKWIADFISRNRVDAIISDNRYGIYHPSIPSVFVTHQLRIKAPFLILEKVLQQVNYLLISRFKSCWVPDQGGKVNLAGQLSHPHTLPKIGVEYLGGLSRLEKKIGLEKEYDLLVILSGPEPQRSLLESKMMKELASCKGTVLLVRGLPGNDEKRPAAKNITIRNHLTANELAIAFCTSELIISRSGYTTVMDILKLHKKAVLIPTPGQTEQEYLAQHLEQQGWCINITQQEFSLEVLLQRIQSFEYKLPQLDLENYKNVVDGFLKKLKG